MALIPDLFPPQIGNFVFPSFLVSERDFTLGGQLHVLRRVPDLLTSRFIIYYEEDWDGLPGLSYTTQLTCTTTIAIHLLPMTRLAIQ